MYVCSVGPSYEQAHLIRRINIVLTLRFVAHFSGAANPDGGQEWRVGHLSPAKSDSGPSFGTQVSAVCENVEVDPLEAFCRELVTTYCNHGRYTDGSIALPKVEPFHTSRGPREPVGGRRSIQ